MRVFAIAVAVTSLSGLLLVANTLGAEETPTLPTGYAWSDTIGSIDLSCENSGVCGSLPFGLSIDESGNISGYAWSDNVGWISANAADLSPQNTNALHAGRVEEPSAPAEQLQRINLVPGSSSTPLPLSVPVSPRRRRARTTQ